MKRRGHTVLVEKNAGLGSGYPDELYLKAGAGIWAELAYAVIITVIAILVIQSLGRLADRSS